MNQAMNGESSDSYRIPESQELAAQYLLLYSMSGEGDDLENYRYSEKELDIFTAETQRRREGLRFGCPKHYLNIYK